MWSSVGKWFKFGICVAGGYGAFFMSRRNKFCSCEEDVTTLPDGNDLIRMCPYVSWDYNWDKRAVYKKPKKGEPPVQDTKQYSNNERNIYCFASPHAIDSDNEADGASELGHGQIRSLVVLLKTGLELSAIYHSPATKDKQLAEALQSATKAVSKQEEPLLLEGSPAFSVPLSSWGPPEEREVFEDHPRFEAAFRSFFYRPDGKAKSSTNEAIVAPPDFVKYFVCRALQLPPEAFERFVVPTCSMTWISIAGDGVASAKTIGDTGFLPAKLITADEC